MGQVCEVRRRVEQKGQTTTETRYAITSLGREAGPAALLRYVRGHWEIENRLHYVRDVTLGEDASPGAQGGGAGSDGGAAHATLCLLRLNGVKNVAAALRQTGWLPGQALRLLGLAYP